MKKTLAALIATTALTAAIGLPAWSDMRAQADAGENPTAAVGESGQSALPLILASHDDDDDDDDHRERSDDDDEDDDDCDDDDDDDGCRGASNPAPVGTVAPPQNGLFGSGAAPRVQVN
jgi:hypothetical protein